MKAIVLTGFGINADVELAEAFRLAGAEAQRLHVSELVENPGALAKAKFVAFPGGFSYGDHLGSGQVLATFVRSRLKGELKRFIDDGGFVIGICNGFQVLVKTGLLPDIAGLGEREVSLVHNRSGHFIDRWVQVRFEAASRCLWTGDLAPRMLPIRHGEGRFVCKDVKTLETLERKGLVALRYEGENPNGSVNEIAGICDRSGRVFGLMPHPEAFLCPENHPYRRRGVIQRTGVELFEHAVASAKK